MINLDVVRENSMSPSINTDNKETEKYITSDCGIMDNLHNI